MKCKNHVTDPSCVVGVCASCVRERLLSVIRAQEEAESQSVYQNYSNSNSVTVTNPTHRRSVSPYVNRQKSSNSVNPVPVAQRPYNKLRLNPSQSDKRFYSSPQIALNTGGCIGGGSNSSSNRKKQSLIRFSSISNIFRSNSRKGNTDSKISNHRVSVSVSVSSSTERCGSGARPSSVAVTASPSWLSNVLPSTGVRQKNKAFHDVSRNRRCVPDRGMSPVRSSDDGDEDEDDDEDEFSDGSSVYESAESCKQMKKPAVSPNSMILNVKGKSPADGGFSGEVRAPAVGGYISDARLFSANRSRKLADFGRCDPHR